jgi:uncharacterized protein (TIGR02284 family)
MKFSLLASLLLMSSVSLAVNKEPTQLDDLVRGELAALKAYDQVLKETKDEQVKSRLQTIRNDHEKAVSHLSKYVAGKKELLEDTESAGPWGSFAKTWTKGASLFGNDAALAALRQGEEHGIREYKEALEDDSISHELKQAIKTEMLPKQEKHIETLKTFTR